MLEWGFERYAGNWSISPPRTTATAIHKLQARSFTASAKDEELEKLETEVRRSSSDVLTEVSDQVDVNVSASLGLVEASVVEACAVVAEAVVDVSGSVVEDDNVELPVTETLVV